VPLKAIGKRLVVKPSENRETTSPGGIIMPTYLNPSTRNGVVFDQGKAVENIRVSQTVVFPAHAGYEHGDFVILNEDDVLAVEESG